MANRYANLVGSNKIKDEWQKINTGFDLVQQDVDQLQADLAQEIADREAAVEYVDQRVDNIIVGGGPDKDPELVDIRTVDPSYTPGRTINVAGDVTRDMQAQFMSHKAETAYTNYLINGAFDIWQRGTSFSPAGGNHIYTADRWRLSRQAGDTSGLNVMRVSGDRSVYALRFGRVVGDSKTNTYSIAQQLEQLDAVKFRGQRVTLSIWMKKGSGFSGDNDRVRLYIQTSDLANPAIVTDGRIGSSDMKDSINEWATLTETLQRYTITGDLSDSINALLVVIHNPSPSGTAVENDFVHIEQVQLIAGDASVPFQPRSVASELLLCQRYYQKSYALDRVPGSIVDSGREVLISQNTQYFGRTKRVQLFMPMRVTPTVTLYSNKSGEPGKVYNDTKSIDIDGDAGNVMDSSFMAGALSGSDISVEDSLTFHWTADAEI